MMRLLKCNRFVVTLIACGLLGSSPGLAAPVDVPVPPKLAGVRVPFVANEGHVDARVAYYAHTFAGTVFVTRQGEMVYALRGHSPLREGAGARHVAKPGPGWSLTETLVGGRAQPTAGVSAEARVSFFLGGDPTRHRRDRPTYASVSLGEVWPGVAVSLHAAGQSVEKLFTVRPGASPAIIRVRVDGATTLRVTSDGALVGKTGLGEVAFTAPLAYQEADGLRQPVPVAYRLSGREYGFTLGAYDPTRPVVIDPLLQSTFLGGGGADVAAALAIHPATGDLYVAGTAGSANFPGTAGGAQSSLAGVTDAFVTRLNSTLTTILQSTFLGGGSFDDAEALAIHPTTGDVYVAGFTDSPTFPGAAGGAQPSNGGGRDAFVARLNSTLTTLVQSTFLGGVGSDGVRDIAIPPTGGDVYVAGFTDSPTFPGTTGGAQPSNGGLQDAFVARLTSTLTTLVQSTFLGGSGPPGFFVPPLGLDEAFALAIHPLTGNVYVVGSTSSTSFPGTAGGVQASNGGGTDAFVARFTSTLTTLLQSTLLGGSGSDVANALAIHPTTGDVYVAGSTTSAVFPGTAGGAQPINGGTQDAFVTRLASTLTTLVQSTFLGGSGADSATALVIHPTTGDVYLAGSTFSSNFPGTFLGVQASLGGVQDAFVAHLASSLTTLVQSSYLGGSGADAASAIALHPTTKDVYVVGGTLSTTFPGTSGGAQPSFGGLVDGFVARLTADLSATGAGIPTLSEWAYVVMVALLVLGGLLTLRRRRLS